MINAGPSGDRCPHGDPTCPCQDVGDPCHYEGHAPLPCPNPPVGVPEFVGWWDGLVKSPPHCHVEACEWSLAVEKGFTMNRYGADHRPCTLHFLGLPGAAELAARSIEGLDLLRGTPWWGCGLLRFAASVAAPYPPPELQHGA